MFFRQKKMKSKISKLFVFRNEIELVDKEKFKHLRGLLNILAEAIAEAMTQ